MNPKLFADRHIGLSDEEMQSMLAELGVASLDELIDQTVPSDIRLKDPLYLPSAMSEVEYATHIHELASKNQIFKSYIGMGWYETAAPAAIIRNVFENPVWYTSYTPYQAEISQGRLEALLNFQTMISDLTALPLANCSLLDDATAGAEAASMMFALRSKQQVKANANILFVDEQVFPRIISVLKTRTKPQGIVLEIGKYSQFTPTAQHFGVIVQYPNAEGAVTDYSTFVTSMQQQDIKVAVAADIMSLVLLTAPGQWGADICFGSTQRFGIPMFFGGPSAAYFATKDEYKRLIPGRIIGISKDAYGNPALRMALQTREQHIKREKATSNICTAQALLATMAGFYGVYHGPHGLKQIATTIHELTAMLAEGLRRMKCTIVHDIYFDTLKIQLPQRMSQADVQREALNARCNFNYFHTGEIGISINETTTEKNIREILSVFGAAAVSDKPRTETLSFTSPIPAHFYRNDEILTAEVFNSYHTETELMRYAKKLERRDISLAHSMISLGSCTMKLNAASEMMPISNPLWGNIHPYAPKEQTGGYRELINNLSDYLSTITGFADTSLQPNSGAAGEYAGLRVIRAYQESIGEGHRNVVIIPESAHGTNPASANQAGYDVVVVKCTATGAIDYSDLEQKILANKDLFAALMITYPSTYGIFDTDVPAICQLVHDNGGQVYMDGANMNAQVGLTNPGIIGADVCHLNLHKTFAIPHGGGGPGVGSISVSKHLTPFLPKHYIWGDDTNAVAAAPYGSAGILPITYGYIRMMGQEGLKKATKVAILNANYLAHKLQNSFGVLYRGENGRVGHELILECRNIKAETGISE
ncbi:MAG: aminomethyl-transferring glycine dehydrogenase, partial [Bacteroidales bacterium]